MTPQCRELCDKFDELIRSDREEAARLLMRFFGDTVNVLSEDKEVRTGLLNGFTYQHRTLQQSIMKMLVQLILDWSKCCGEHKPMYVDLRNEASAALAAEIAEALKDSKYVYRDEANLPTI